MKRLVYFLFFVLLLSAFGSMAMAGERVVTVYYNTTISDSLIAYHLNEAVAQGNKCESYTKASPKKPILAEKLLKVKGIIRVCICSEYSITVTKGEIFDPDVINSKAKIIFDDFFPDATVEMKDKRKQGELANR